MRQKRKTSSKRKLLAKSTMKFYTKDTGSRTNSTRSEFKLLLPLFLGIAFDCCCHDAGIKENRGMARDNVKKHLTLSLPEGLGESNVGIREDSKKKI